ncbi:trypsin-like peptidase [Paucimonas lemoignei]|uniref:Trypsin-like peptidase n=1 Tax=Paucimonas lemoignei TaxID=29443 RepID=A0A4R3HQ08_PAULE|nr:serine protease [Paucimonas lemoignei]TCS33489.1 trypsin-like peptidase [Paucimonas lemoignei]
MSRVLINVPRCLPACVFIAGLLLNTVAAAAGDLPRTIEVVKPSVVGIGSYLKTRSPAGVFFGTGFAVGDGLSVITNAHVVKNLIGGEGGETSEQLGVIVGKGDLTEFRRASVVALDPDHDLAHLRLSGAPLPALELGDSSRVVEGQSVAFTGFPLGMVLGLHHATHRANVSSLTPIAMPALNAAKLDVKTVAQLRKAPFVIFQLDGTAYPGNSGSPVYDPETGAVVGVINMVFVKGAKEAAISTPSGITYAIPSRYVRELLQRK